MQHEAGRQTRDSVVDEPRGEFLRADEVVTRGAGAGAGGDGPGPAVPSPADVTSGGQTIPGPEELKHRPRELNLFGRRLRLPRHPFLRIGLGSALVAGGLLGFLPVLGFWMVPLGIAVLAIDLPVARRLWRSMKRVGIGLIRRFRTRRT